MKRILIVAATVMLLAGCGGVQVKNSSTMAIAPPKIDVAPPAGYVPVHIENPSLLPQEVCLFEGNTAVTIIPDARGGWKLSRPAFVCYRIDGANSRNNWHEYAQIWLPRNFSFVAVSRINRIWEMSRPYFRSYRTGADPLSATYMSVTPLQRQVSCGALVQLEQSPSSAGSLNIVVEIDFSSLGPKIADGLTKTVYGR